jgi:hypothetical protein
MILDFICELERILTRWPDAASWSLTQIADLTKTSLPQVVDFLSDALDRELELTESISKLDGTQALGVLKERMSPQLDARDRRMAERRQKAIKAYDGAMEKMRVLQSQKNWRGAYKTMSYYVGVHEKDVPAELLLNLCGECLRLGFKAGANMQELSLWLRKGVAAALTAATAEAMDEAVDFVDAYGELFETGGDAERGKRLIASALDQVRVQATGLGLSVPPRAGAAAADATGAAGGSVTLADGGVKSVSL